MKPRCCTYCGQTLPERRLGIEFTPQQGRIFDAVLDAGDVGVSRDILADRFACDRSTISTQVFYINEKLRDRGYHIRGYGNYRLIKWGEKHAA